MSNEKPKAGANYAVLSSVLAALLFAASSAAQARIINAASPSLADVRKAIASAADGDTVIVPAGTAAWTSGLTITKGITIQGQTTVNSDNGTANDQTVLVDNLLTTVAVKDFSASTSATKHFALPESLLRTEAGLRLFTMARYSRRADRQSADRSLAFHWPH